MPEITPSRAPVPEDPALPPSTAWLRRFLLLAALLAVALGFQSSRSLFEPDEGRYAAIAAEMVRSGDYVVPRLSPTEEHWAKPPLTYWAIAASLRLGGFDEFTVRLPGALAFALTVLLIWSLPSWRARRPRATVGARHGH